MTPDADREERDREAMRAAGLQPMSLDPARKCQGGTTPVAPRRIRKECTNCSRLRPFGEPAGADDIDPVGAWVDATFARAGYCRERLALLADQQVVAQDEMAGLHPANVRPHPGGAKPAEHGGGDAAITPLEVRP